MCRRNAQWYSASFLFASILETVCLQDDAKHSWPPLPADSGLEVLAVQRVSKTQAWQRTGRAGREDSGICYRLYTEDEFEKFEKMTVPEIQRWVQLSLLLAGEQCGLSGSRAGEGPHLFPHRCDLASVILQLLAMKVPNVLTFDFVSKPSPGKPEGGQTDTSRGGFPQEKHLEQEKQLSDPVLLLA